MVRIQPGAVKTWWRRKWKHFPRYWPFVRGIHRSPVNSPHKDQWHGDLMFSLICVWINGWVNNREAGDLRRYRAHHDITVMMVLSQWSFLLSFEHHNRLSFDVFFDLCLNKRLNKQSWGWWFETLSRPLWRHRNDMAQYHILLHTVQQWLKQNICQSNTCNKHPLSCPHGQAMGCLLWGFCRKLAAL